jgi:hypothetical protein
MKKIKFRAWDAEIDQMEMWENLDLELLFSEENTCDIMQYTGLKDQNGVEIYEGDVVSLDNRETFKEFKWVGCGYFFDDDSPISDYTNIKVIGNIYENKELIK